MSEFNHAGFEIWLVWRPEEALSCCSSSAVEGRLPMALSRYSGYKLEWIGPVRSKCGPYGSCPASDSALVAVTRPKSPNFAPLAPPPKGRAGGE